ncbi:MAG: NADH-quinone oxidoreductase subunit NuoH [Chloroflexi bacterium]|nr:NADH-quinone oxidoreductase subunit NuoH [Chloroflexota bacterium]
MEPINDIFIIVRNLISDILVQNLQVPAWISDTVLTVLGIVIFLLFMVVTVLYQTLAERKMVGFVQDRYGPNRVGPWGLLQAMADALKLLTKEDIIPAAADKVTFQLAPLIMLTAALVVYAVIPFGRGLVIADVNIGLLYLISMSSLATIGVLMAGWSSNNKYSLLGAMRGVAQMVSYEVPLVLSILGVVMLTGSLQMSQIVSGQSGLWFIVWQPLGFIVYFIAAIAEINRCPFDLPESESELIAGYHIEYSGMRFALFFLAEYINAFTVSAVAATLFFGGWQGPILPPYIWFVIKAWAIFWVLLWIRDTLPRVRVDHLMGFAWKVLIPLALLNIFITGGLLVPLFQSLAK